MATAQDIKGNAATGGVLTPGGQQQQLSSYLGGGQAAPQTNLQNIYQQLLQQAGPSLAIGQQGINSLNAQNTTSQYFQNLAGQSQVQSGALQQQQLGITAANTDIQQLGLQQQGQQNVQQQGYEQQGYGLSLAQLAQQGQQNKTQYGLQTAGNKLSASGLTQQYGLAENQYGTNLGNLNAQLGYSQQGAQNTAVANGALNTAGYAGPGGTQAQLQEGYQTSLAGLQNQNQATTQQFQQSMQQLGLSQASESSSYKYGQQQLSEQGKQANISQQAEQSGFKYSQTQLNQQKQTLNNIAKSNGISTQQATNQLNQALDSMGLSDTLDTAGLLQEINQAQLGQANILEGAAGGALALTSGLGGFLNQTVKS